MSRPFTLAGYDVAPVARRPNGKVLVTYLTRAGAVTDRYREAELHELRRPGTHIAELKAIAARLPLVSFATDLPPSTRPLATHAFDGAAGASVTPRRAGGFLHAHHALPQED